ncbi:MAG: GLUG motif-containing protein [Planctomycetota bacterium]
MQTPRKRWWRIVLVLAAFSVVAGCACAKYSGGTGFPDDPYKIGSTADLLTLATDINDYNKYFILISDIDLNPNLPGGQVFTTAVIARDTDSSNGVFDGISFTGVFDGAGRKIVNLTINTNGAGNDYLALFGRISTNGVVKNLDLENTYIRSGDNSTCIGGLVGQNWGTSISKCSAIVDIAAGAKSSYLGGLVGDNGGNISGCLSAGTVVGGDDSYYLGGLTGDNYNSDINNCYSTADVTAGENCYEFGGLVGRNEGNISNCFSTGPVAGGTSAYRFGSPVGSNKGNATGCYFLLGSGPDNGSGIPLTDAQMKQQSSFLGWDFVDETRNGYEDYWRLCNEGMEYPKLSWQYLPGDIACPDGVDISDLTELCDQWLIKAIPFDLVPPNGDGIVNFADFAVFAEGWGIIYDIDDLLDFAQQWLLTGPDKWPADVWPRSDGIVNFADFAVFAEGWGIIYDIDDLLDFAHQWLRTEPSKWPADVWPWPNGDSKVNASDLAVMCEYWLQ